MKAKLSTSDPSDWFVYYTDSSGKRRKVRKGINRIKSVRERKEYGRQLCDRVNYLLAGGSLHTPSAISVLRELVEMKRGTLRRRSWQSYTYAVNKFEKWLPETDLPIQEVTRQLARDFIDSLYKEGHQGKSINGVRGFLSSLFNLYSERHEGFVNPFQGIRKASETIGRNIAFTDYQKEELWSWMNGEMQLFTKFIYNTYLRPLELLRLRVGDVDPLNGIIIIQGHQSKNKRQQSVQIPNSFIELVRQQGYERLPGDWYLFGRGLRPGPVPLGRNQVSKLHKVVLKGLGYGNQYTLYSWKHTGVVNAYRNGIDVYAIMRQLRHHSLDMTQIYLKSLGLEENLEFKRKMV